MTCIAVSVYLMSVTCHQDKQVKELKTISLFTSNLTAIFPIKDLILPVRTNIKKLLPSCGQSRLLSGS